MGLRKGQKELVEIYRHGHCAIPAIPGGGKTYCLSIWAAEMIEQGFHKPGKILIVTYMNSAVSNFKQRISNELEKRGIFTQKDFVVSTIHGLCLQIVKERPEHFLASEEFRIIEETEKYLKLRQAVDEIKRLKPELLMDFIEVFPEGSKKQIQANTAWNDVVVNIISSNISDFKSKGLTPLSIKEITKEDNQPSFVKLSAFVYEIYDKKLKYSGLFDFDDMLYNAKKLLLEDENVLKKYQDKFTFVCEDEAQDSNSIQSEILHLIAKENFLRVGDSNQAICGSFANSDFNLFKDFCNRLDTKVYNITQSSRNSKEIINIANYFVNYVREKHPVLNCRDGLVNQMIEMVDEKDIFKNPTTEKYGIRIDVYENFEEEAKEISKKAKVAVERQSEKNIAVLVPTLRKIQIIAEELKKLGIIYEIIGEGNEERNRVLTILGKLILFIAEPENKEYFANVMLDCLLIDEYKEVEIIENKEKKKFKQKEILLKFILENHVEDLLYPVGGEITRKSIPYELINLRIWADFLSKFNLLKEIIEFPSIILEKLILHIADRLEFSREERAIAQKVAEEIRNLRSSIENWKLSDLAFELLKSKNIFNYFTGVIWDLKGYQPKPGVVTLTTYHKSKGLEWDIVFLTCLNNSDFPVKLNDKFKGEYWYLKQQYKNPRSYFKSEMKRFFENKTDENPAVSAKIENISERSRLLYVGITRAKQFLMISGTGNDKTFGDKASDYLIELKKFVDLEAKAFKS